MVPTRLVDCAKIQRSTSQLQYYMVMIVDPEKYVVLLWNEKRSGKTSHKSYIISLRFFPLQGLNVLVLNVSAITTHSQTGLFLEQHSTLNFKCFSRRKQNVTKESKQFNFSYVRLDLNNRTTLSYDKT